MAFVRTEIPLVTNFSYSREPSGRYFSFDYLTPNLKIVAWMEVSNRIYLGAFQYSDIKTSNDYTVLRQELLLTGAFTGIKITKISADTFFLIVDRDLYVIKYDNIENSFSILSTEIDFFTYGGLALRNTLDSDECRYQSYSFYITNIFENEAYFVEYTGTNVDAVQSSNTASFDFGRIVFNPLSNTITKTILRSFSANNNLLNYINFQARFKTKIHKIPNSNNIYMFLALSRTQNPTSNTNEGFDTYIQYSAVMQPDGTEITVHNNIPGLQSPGASNGQNNVMRFAVALTDDLVVFHALVGTNIYTWYNGEITQVGSIRDLPSDNFTSASNNGIVPVEIEPLDENHYMIVTTQVINNGSTVTAYALVFKVVTKEYILFNQKPVVTTYANTMNRHSRLFKIDDDLYSIFRTQSNTSLKLTLEEIKVRAYE